MVGDVHDSNAVVNSDVQFAMTVEAVHTANNPLLLLVYDRLLGYVVHSSLGLTTMIGELCG